MKTLVQYGILFVCAGLIYVFVEVGFAIWVPEGQLSLPLGWIVSGAKKFLVAGALSLLAFTVLVHTLPRRVHIAGTVLVGLLGGMLVMLAVSGVDGVGLQVFWIHSGFLANALGIPTGYLLGEVFWRGKLNIRPPS